MLSIPALLVSAFYASVTFGAVSVVSLYVARRVLPTGDPPTRWLAALLIGMTGVTAVFHGLLWIGLFDRRIALVLAVVGLAGMRLRGGSVADELAGLAGDVRRMARLLRRAGPGAYGAGLLVASLAVVATASRCLALRPLAWDTLTYHGVKAAMWVQSGGPLTLVAPGGWSLYRHRLGGAESLAAWVMLPTRNDLLVCALDVLWWIGLACAVWALGRALGLRVRLRIAAALYVLFIPTTWSLVGSGYVELPLTLVLLGGVVFADRARRRGEVASWLLAMSAFGLAAGMRSMLAPLCALACGLLLLRALRRGGPVPGRAAAAGALLAALPIVPWLAANAIETGYPLDVPLVIGGLRLGAENAAFAWYGQTDLVAYRWSSELHALRPIFALAPQHPKHLSLLTLVPILVSLAGAPRVWRRSRTLFAWLTLVGLGVLAAFYHPDFTPVRVVWAKSNGRFLLPVACIAVAVSATTCRGRGLWARAYPLALVTGAGIHLAMNAFHGWSIPTARLAAGIAAAGLLGGSMAVWGLRRTGRMLRPPLALALTFVAVLGLSLLRDVDREYRQLVTDFVRHPARPYWLDPARALEDAEPGRRIAVTSGPKKRGDNWPLYYFLGRDLQHTLHYAPIGESGEIVPFGPDGARRRAARYDVWLARLEAMQISHVMSFRPASVELALMLAHPERFERIGPADGRSGLFRVRAAGEAGAGD